MKLSIGMIVKNEEQYLDMCLKALESLRKNVESELIIVDTGSTDSTVEIAKRYTDKVYYFEWCNDFSAARNEILKYATGEWFMSLDADEVFEDTAEIERFFHTDIKDYVTASFRMQNYIGEKGDDTLEFDAIRIYKNAPDFHYENAIHEQPRSAMLDMADGIPNVFRLKSKAIHYGYMADDVERAERKRKRNRDILYSEYEEKKDQPMYLMQMCDHEISEAHFDKAEEFARLMLEKSKGDEIMTSVAYMLFAEMLYINGKDDELLQAARDYFKMKQTFKHLADIPIYLYRGIAKYRKKDYSGAVKDIKQYMKLYKKNMNATSYESFVHPIKACNSEMYIIGFLYCISSYEELENYKEISKLMNSESPMMFSGDKQWHERFAGDYVKHAVILASNGDKSVAENILKNGDDALRKLLRQVLDEANNSQNEETNEMRQYANQIKAMIREMIDKGLKNEALIYIVQCKQLCPNDAELEELERQCMMQ